ncbi:type II toxin-antitoxin system VapC family toxin [Testudinibacter sp. TR-2022]|nr:type II toxin-antitoxin system VapC family toxin [Pasteurellaceae bacterium Phil11]TNH24345.1 type II toxin-antitoxin system VapC family toxin [Testudinibacter sp. TR-2022]TNH25013.1 type II toxin-antitoxin system VapC family toxin [Testudinibacter sp. TR-2022]
MMYMLDTNICIYIINHKPPQVFEKFNAYRLGELCISSITAAELAFGVEKSGSQKNKIALQKFLTPLDIIPLGESAIWHYAQLRHNLEKSGQLIGSLDMLIAAQALALDCTLVTNNAKEFQRITTLKLENWI